ncbi:MAG: YqaA family protein [Pseudomonadota bacterium]
MIRNLYDWTMRNAEGPNALWFLAIVSFIESSVFPIPPDVIMIPMILAAPHKAWLIAGVCTAASVAGGVAGYAIGYMAFESVGAPVLDFYGKLDKFDEFRAYFNEYGFWAVSGAGLTPFPYKVITIASGATQLDMVTFILASIAGRAPRFFLIAALLWKFGPPIRDFIERWLGLLATIFFVMLFGGFIAIGYLI